MDAYEIFSILSGIVLLVGAVLPGLRPRERATTALGGILFIGYAIYVFNQTSGTFYFPAFIFVLPFVGAGYLAITVWERHGKNEKARQQHDEVTRTPADEP